MDFLKLIEMTQRFLNTSDMKNQEFHIMLTGALIEVLKEDKDFNPETLLVKYDEYRKKWKT